jgi:hypothetical protein
VTKEELRDLLTAAIAAIEADDEQAAKAAGMQLALSVLLDIHRIADALEIIAGRQNSGFR